MKNPGQNFLYRLVWTSSQTWFQLVHNTEVYGAENIPPKGPFLLACNHASFYDPPAFGGNLPRELHYFARKSLFKGRFGQCIRDCNAIPIDRGADSDLNAFRNVFAALKKGGALLLFPEGTRSPDGNLQSGKKGVGLIACRAQVPIIPARVFGTYEIWGRHRKFPNFNHDMQIVIGPGLAPQDFDLGKKEPARYQKAADIIMDRIKELHIPLKRAI